jgi:Ser/Thr protein kinase RdoA (MazF antagonist)
MEHSMDKVAAVQRHMESELGLSVRSLKKLSVTAYNEHYRVEVDGKPHHLVIYSLPEELPIKGILFEHAILRHLTEQGYAETPSLVVVNDKSLHRVDDLYFALTEWIDGCHTEQDIDVSSSELAEAARALARFHQCTKGLELHLDYFPEHIFVYTAAHFLDAHEELLAQLAERVREDSDAFNDEARQNLERFLPLARTFLGGFDRALYDRVRAADDTGVVHGDYRRINLVFADERVTKVFDYNCCFNDIRLWDAAYAALSFGGKETVGPLRDLDQAAAFLREYDQVNTLTDDEWRLLPAFLIFVVVKLTTAAMSSWWINERIDTLERLLDGDADEIVRRAAA